MVCFSEGKGFSLCFDNGYMYIIEAGEEQLSLLKSCGLQSSGLCTRAHSYRPQFHAPSVDLDLGNAAALPTQLSPEQAGDAHVSWEMPDFLQVEPDLRGCSL